MTDDQCVYCKGKMEHRMWVQCEACPQWVHVQCIPEECLSGGEYPSRSSDIAAFECSAHGTARARLALKGKRRRVEAKEEPERAGTRRYRLRKRGPLDYIALNEGQDVRLRHEHPHRAAFQGCFTKWSGLGRTVTSAELQQSFAELREPVLVADPEHSGMQTPAMDEQVLADVLGADYSLDVMDVQSQQNERWTMGQWKEYMHTARGVRDRIRNVISLEVSHVPEFGQRIRRPRAVEDNDLVDLVWPVQPAPEIGAKPKVQKYVLMSAANAYTDFHLDFAGTSVYYSLLRGAKQFLLFPPTPANLGAYKAWCADDNQGLIFLGDRLQDGVSFSLRPGDLFMIPSGFIHAVYTPEDSFVVGGNYLCLRDLSTHIRIVRIEQETQVPKKFTFPKFERVMGLTAEWLLEGLPERLQLITHEHAVALLDYLRDTRLKYKPAHYHTKSTMLASLEKALEGCEPASGP